MSDTTADTAPRGDTDKRRTLVSLGMAVALHGAVLLAFALGIGIGSGPVATTPVTIELQSAEGMEGASGAGGSGGAGGSAGAGPAAPAQDAAAGGPAAAAGTTAVVAVPAGPAAAAPSAGAGAGSGAGGFVIPTPRTQPAAASTGGSGPAFREAGGRTGVAQGIPSVASTVPAPVVAPVQQGRGAGSAAATGAGSSVQRSGTGVLVPGSSGTSSGGKLDLGALDQSLKAGGKGSGKPGGAGGGAVAGAGTASGGTGAGGAVAGAGSGGAGAGGTGSGTAGSGTGGGQSYSVSWDSADAGKGRKLLGEVLPKVPAWVGVQGLTLRVDMSFSVLPDGLVTAVATERSSGYSDVDSAVINALRQWRYSVSAGTLPAKGRVSFVIRAKSSGRASPLPGRTARFPPARGRLQWTTVDSLSH